MAANTIKHKISEEFLHCALCTDTIRNPLALACLHSFCKECLRQYISYNHFTQWMPCPICREKTDVTRGLRSLKRNFHLEQLRGLLADVKVERPQQRQSDRSLELCTRHGTQQLSLFCYNCEIVMCVVCSEMPEHARHEKTSLITAFRKLVPGKLLPKVPGVAAVLQQKETLMRDVNKHKTLVESQVQYHRSNAVRLKERMIAEVETYYQEAMRKIRYHEKREMKKINGCMNTLDEELLEIRKIQSTVSELPNYQVDSGLLSAVFDISYHMEDIIKDEGFHGDTFKVFNPPAKWNAVEFGEKVKEMFNIETSPYVIGKVQQNTKQTTKTSADTNTNVRAGVEQQTNQNRIQPVHSAMYSNREHKSHPPQAQNTTQTILLKQSFTQPAKPINVRQGTSANIAQNKGGQSQTYSTNSRTTPRDVDCKPLNQNQQNTAGSHLSPKQSESSARSSVSDDSRYSLSDTSMETAHVVWYPQKESVFPAEADSDDDSHDEEDSDDDCHDVKPPEIVFDPVDKPESKGSDTGTLGHNKYHEQVIAEMKRRNSDPVKSKGETIKGQGYERPRSSDSAKVHMDVEKCHGRPSSTEPANTHAQFEKGQGIAHEMKETSSLDSIHVKCEQNKQFLMPHDALKNQTEIIEPASKSTSTLESLIEMNVKNIAS